MSTRGAYGLKVICEYSYIINLDSGKPDLYHLYSIWGSVSSEGIIDLIHSGTLTEVMDAADQTRREKGKSLY